MIDFNPRKLTFENIDRFYIKRSIYQFIIAKSTVLNGDLLDIGCGEMPYKNEILANYKINKYVGLDIEGALEYKTGIKPDILWDGNKMPFENGSFDSGFATEVLEHCPNPLLTLQEINRVLKPNAPFIMTVPFIWPTHESPFDFYRYTPFALKCLLQQSGFTKIEINCLGGWDASMAQMISLWIKRRGFPKRFQKLLFLILKPFVLKLYKKDKIRSSFDDQNMFTSLGVVAWKN